MPLGADDLDKVMGDIAFRFTAASATSSSTWRAGPTTKKKAEGDRHPKPDPPKPGEVVYADAAKILCRRWNWRQDVRSLVTPLTTRAVVLTIQAERRGRSQCHRRRPLRHAGPLHQRRHNRHHRRPHAAVCRTSTRSDRAGVPGLHQLAPSLLKTRRPRPCGGRHAAPGAAKTRWTGGGACRRRPARSSGRPWSRGRGCRPAAARPQVITSRLGGGDLAIDAGDNVGFPLLVSHHCPPGTARADVHACIPASGSPPGPTNRPGSSGSVQAANNLLRRRLEDPLNDQRAILGAALAAPGGRRSHRKRQPRPFSLFSIRVLLGEQRIETVERPLARRHDTPSPSHPPRSDRLRGGSGRRATGARPAVRSGPPARGREDAWRWRAC